MSCAIKKYKCVKNRYLIFTFFSAKKARTTVQPKTKIAAHTAQTIHLLCFAGIFFSKSLRIFLAKIKRITGKTVATYVMANPQKIAVPILMRLMESIVTMLARKLCFIPPNNAFPWSIINTPSNPKKLTNNKLPIATYTPSFFLKNFILYLSNCLNSTQKTPYFAVSRFNFFVLYH